MPLPAQETDAWRHVEPIAPSDAERFQASRRALGEFLASRFAGAFGVEVDEVLFETFPDGLYATLYVSGRGLSAHNVWAVAMSSRMREAAVEVSVVVLPSSSRLE